MEGSEISLRSLPLGKEYRSDRDDLVTDFYVPCLSRSRKYCRAVGFFTSTSLSVAAQGVATLIRGGGRMFLIASPLLAEDNVEAIRKGYVARSDAVIYDARRALILKATRRLEEQGTGTNPGQRPEPA